ncbi:bile acid 7-dehydroxylase 1/3 family protein [Leptospira broomii serovar Hurstbridge str. 5399]|uniref:Bile acid 7-dehydroxylase 1/3 family protein n=1 Tax=Leptospira broomii serovar Hurstbridge str. 5399 TaxID=1049789 RepID=T0F549_9LEPT|nr:SDR family NAD(P)-dependent oxidoreductase [Leptospira broomii]EQA46240.1 bile acid 7-dehydroxylase 1/3 family protein [Leptospira broomii serovar Hurstbridge str. 5399]
MDLANKTILITGANRGIGAALVRAFLKTDVKIIYAGYSASKAALHSVIQSIRWELKSKNIKVIGIFPGPIDTDMNKGFPIEKASSDSAAEEIVKGIEEDQEDIFPDTVSKNISGI